jgi:hypothetical protein
MFKMGSSFSAENENSDFYYQYARFTIYVDLSEDGIDINHITRGPFGDHINLYDIDSFIRKKMIQDLGTRVKRGEKNDMGIQKRKALKNLQIELRKTMIKET